jgi:hypothetical protein
MHAMAKGSKTKTKLAEERKARLAAALRANLRRRKERARVPDASAQHKAGRFGTGGEQGR